MDFAFSDEQNMLRDQARSFLADRYGLERVAELADSDEGWDPASWNAIAELGWTGLSIAEDQGGSGMGFVDEAVLFEELGRALLPGPYFATIGLALPALAAARDHLAAIATGERSATLAWAEPSVRGSLVDVDAITTKAEQTNGSWTLTGEKHLVPDAIAAALFVVAARSNDGVGLYLVTKDDTTVATDSTMDRTRRLSTVSFAGSAAEELVDPKNAPGVLETIRDRAYAALALEAAGIGSYVVESSIAYVSERKQFGKPIGTYQAVSHQVANSYMEVELARSLASWAAWCVDTNDDQRAVAAAAAKAAAADAAVDACERAIQVHGGIGFTWEHPLHRFYKRAQWIQSFDGYPATQRAALARELLS